MSRMRRGDESRMLAGRLLDLLENSKPLPLLHEQIRVRKLQVYSLVDAMREAGEVDEAGVRPVPPVLEAATAVEQAVYRAPPIPLSDEVRLPREQVAQLISG